MISKEEAERASKLSLEQLQQEYPKAGMIFDYVFKHYPDDKDSILRHKLLLAMIFGDYSNTQIEEMIDKLAIFNGWTKYEPKAKEEQ